MQDERSVDSVCRDFLRNTCRRGKRCKYQHSSPEPEEPINNNNNNSSSGCSSVLFCHDFQNKGCPRRNCRFVHCSREEEEVFRESGRLPFNAAVSAHLQGLVPPEMLQGPYTQSEQNLKYKQQNWNAIMLSATFKNFNFELSFEKYFIENK